MGSKGEGASWSVDPQTTKVNGYEGDLVLDSMSSRIVPLQRPTKLLPKSNGTGLKIED
jgi:hypothetical protein